MHAPKHTPVTGTGFQVCTCGATRRIENGVVCGSWHVCKLCVVTPCEPNEPSRILLKRRRTITRDGEIADVVNPECTR